MIQSMNATKPLYKGKFDYVGEVHKFYVHAQSRRQAKTFFLHQLAAKINKPFGLLWRIYDGSMNNYNINKEPKHVKNG